MYVWERGRTRVEERDKKKGEGMEEEEERKYVGSQLGTVAAFQ